MTTFVHLNTGGDWLVQAYTLVSHLGEELVNLSQELKTALLFESQGRFKDAMHLYRKILKRRPQEQRAHQRLGTLAFKTGDHKAAVRHLKMVTMMTPSNAQSWEKLGDAHSAQDRYDDAIAAYSSGLSVSDDPVRLLCKLGDVYRRSGSMDTAEQTFRDALGINPQHTFATIGLGQIQQDRLDFVGAIRSYAEASAGPIDGAAALKPLKRLLDVSVQSWHFPMMSDHVRNDIYDAAIRDTIRPGDIVLDIGCGSGLLSMMAARAGAERVYACDDNAHITQVARNVVEKNGYAQRIEVLNKRSTELQVGRDIPQRANVLVCEIFDVSVVGEDALHSIRHALSNLLTPDARMIPVGVDIYAAPVESKGLRARFSVGKSCGFDLSPFNLLADRRCIQVPLIHEQYTQLAAPQKTLSISFDRDLKLVGGNHSSFAVERPGNLDGFVFWYALNLGNGHLMSTAPNKNMTHWRQGFLPHWTEPISYQIGDTLHSTTQYRRHLLWMEALTTSGVNPA